MTGGTWTEALQGRGLLPGLPWERSRRAAEPIRTRHPLPAPVAKLLRADATVAGTGVPRTLAAAVAELLRRYGGDEPVALLVNGADDRLVPLLLEPAGTHSLAAAAKRVRAAESAALALPALTPDGLRLASPDLPADARFAVRLGAGPRALPVGEARVQLTLVRTGNGAAIAIAADPRWIAAATVAQLGRRLVALLAAAAARPRLALGDIDLVTPQERERLVGEWAGRRAPYPAKASISALLRNVAIDRPASIAVADAEHRLSYAELVAQAARLRDALLGVGLAPGARVGVLVERSAAQTVALAGVLEAACVAVPLDAALPALRLRAMGDLVGLEAIVAVGAMRGDAESLAAGLRSAPRVIVLAPLDERAAPDDAPLPAAMTGATRAAYVLFTSGSTGEPKAVECPHRAVVRLVVGNRLTRVQADDRVLGSAPFTFDVNLFETWGALLNGATLVQAPAGLVSLGDLAASLATARVTVSCMTPGIMREMAEFQLASLAGLRLLLVAGEAMPPREAVTIAKRFPRLLLVNGYGPTENNYTTEYRVRRGDAADRPVPIGRPIDNTTVYLLDAARRLVPPGMIGELCTGGDGLAIGYVGRPDLTAERFVTLRLPDGRTERVYRTGDLARHRDDGTLEFLGRADAQVKVRGFRVELEEVERTLAAAPGIAMAGVAMIGEGAGRRLRAAVVLARGRSADATAAIAAARAHVEARLPSYMVPAEFVAVARLPLTAHEKVDRRAIAAMTLDAASIASAASAAPTVAPSAARAASPAARAIETALAAIWSDLLGTDAFDRDSAFFEVGGTSLLALRLAEEIRRRMGVELPVVRVFEFPSIARLAAHLAARGRGTSAAQTGAAHAGAARAAASPSARADRRIAIVGIAGRFPGAESPDALWTLLREGREGIRFFSRDEIDASIADRDAPAYSPARGVLDGVEDFEPEFFGLNPRLAAITDPQQRLLLEAAWHAFEDAGIVPGDDASTTGVFTGVSHNGYVERHVGTHPELVESLGDAAVLFANDKDYSALHIAHRLDLRGPAMAVQTSSSTSLTAIAMAVQALRAGQCDLALAGGAAVTVPMASGHLHADGGMFSRDGHTRTFDADASGTVFSDGVAMVLLQRLADAERDGRRILAVIDGVGVTNDGAARASFSAPTVQGQEQCIARAFADAGWRADTVSYLEAHGTGTPLGDPIEIEAATRAFARTTDRRRFCWIGSLKSNVGHLTAAAGAASVIKVVLAMRHRRIPATLHVDRPNPRIDFEGSPFLVARAALDWETESGPRRAGVSSFGVGGTNVHLLLEEYAGPAHPPTTEGAPRILQLSARTPAALRAHARRLAAALAGGPDASSPALDAVASTLRHGRRAFERRAVVVAGSTDEAVTGLAALAAAADEAPRTVARDVILLFPGQGTQSVGAGKALHDANPVFRAAIDRCVKAAGRVEGKPLSHWLFSTAEGVAERQRDTAIAQPVLFALEYALGHTLITAGLRPAAMVGHSIGEFAAAALAGVMTPEAAMRAVVERGRLMAAMTPGAMLAVRLAADEVQARLGDGVVIAAINAPRLTVVSGPAESIAGLQATLEADGIGCRLLQTSHAFHSPSMDEAAHRFTAVMRKVTLHRPSLVFVSCVTGKPISDADATDPAYWSRQLREPVRFAEGLASVSQERPVLLVEAGPRESLATLGLQVLPGRAVGVAMLPVRAEGDERRDFLTAVGALWRHGADGLDCDGLDGLSPTTSVSLPGYPFDRRRLWVEPAAGTQATATPGSARAARGARADGDLRSLLHDQLALIQDQLGLLRGVASAADGRGGRA